MRLWNLVGNRAFIERSAGITVADIDGWRDSRGVTHEIALASELGLGVWLMGWDGSMVPLD